MDKCLLLQSPKKFYEAVPIFYKEAEKFGYWDKYYIATDFSKPHDGLGDNCIIELLKKDYQFSKNMRELLRNKVKEDIFFVCCEDHILMPGNDKKVWDECFDFVANNKNVGFLRLTNNGRVKLTTNDFFAPINKKDPYYVSLQPAIWRRKYFEDTLEYAREADAWMYECRASKKAKLHKKMVSYCVKETVFHRTNFFKEGKYYRHKFAEYAVRNNIKLGKRKVHWKGELYSFDEYSKIYKNRIKNG